MKKFLKYFISILLIIILALALTCAALIYFVKPEQYKPFLNNMLTQTLGYKTSIEGDLKWQFWPTLNLEARKIVITNQKAAATPESTAAVAKAENLATIEDIAFRVHLRPLFKGMIEFNQVTIKKIVITLDPAASRQFVVDRLSADVMVSRQAVDLTAIKAKLYEGTGEGALSIQFAVPQTVIKLKQQFYKLNTGKLLQDVVGAKRINATGEMTFGLTAVGKTQEELLKHLNGEVNFKFAKGHIDGINIPRLINSVIKLLGGKELEQEQLAVATNNVTEFNLLTGRATITNGIVKNDGLKIENPSFNTTGKGTINLSTQAINYELKTVLSRLKADSKLANIQEQLGGSFPTRVVGNIHRPILVPDVPTVLKERFKNFLNEKIDLMLNQEEVKKASEKAKQILHQLLD